MKLVVAAVALLLTGGGYALLRENDDPVRPSERLERFQEGQAERCAGAEDFTVPPIEGVTARPATEADLGAAAAFVQRSGMKATALEVEGDVAAVVLAVIVSPADAERFLVGMNASAQRQATGPPRTSRRSGVRVHAFTYRDGNAVMTLHRGCHALMVRAGDEASGRVVVDAIVKSS